MKLMSAKCSTEEEENNSPTAQCTRRQFLLGQWRSDKTDDATGSDIIQRNEIPTLARRSWSFRPLRIVAGVLAALLVVSAMFGGVAAGQTSDGHVTAGEALQEQEHALELLAELEGLTTKEGVAVSDTVLGSIRDDLAQGNASYRAGAYADAANQYRNASEQAEQVLRQAYTARAGFLLNASQAHLQQLRAEGYTTSKVATTAERLDQLESQRAAVDTLSDARTVHADAVKAHRDVRTLPSPPLVRAVDALLSGLFVVPVGVLLLIGAAAGIVIDRRWSRDEPRNERGNGPAPVADSGSSSRGGDPG